MGKNAFFKCEAVTHHWIAITIQQAYLFTVELWLQMVWDPARKIKI